MSGRAWSWLAFLVLALMVLGAGWLFWVQNSAQPAPVSFELWGLGRWGKVWKVSELVAVSAGIGFLTGFLPLAWSNLSQRRRIRQLDQRLAMQQPADTSSAWR